jgi:hypothetical protein
MNIFKKIVILLCFVPYSAYAACIGSSPNLTAASPARADVADCVMKATEGDTISIPAGSATWTSGLAMSKFIRLVGAGAGKTVLTSNWTPGEKITDAAYIISWNPSNPSLNLPFGVSGITFDLADKTCGFKVTNSSSSPITKLRVNNNVFRNTLNSNGQRTFFIDGNIYGVIDSNTMDAGGPIYGKNANWSAMSFSYGTGDQLFIEDNTFNTTSSGVAGGGVGGRYCARYNTITRNSAKVMLQAYEYHGNQPGANNAGMGMELYGNKIINTSGSSLSVQLFDHRGGMSVAHHNYVDAGVGASVWAKMREEYVDDVNAGEPPVGLTGQPQHVYWSYYWLNQKNGTTFDLDIGNTVTYPTSGEGLLPTDLGRTIPEWNVDAWKGVSPFDGTSGVGCGTLLNRPSTCTAGVGYWATNQSCSDLTGMVGSSPATPISGTLYKCTSTNKWTAYYTPYTYPHPLRSQQNGEVPAYTPPQSPTGLQIVLN